MSIVFLITLKLHSPNPLSTLGDSGDPFPLFTLGDSVTMSYNETGTHKKIKIAHPWVFRGTASAPFVPAQDLRAHGNSLSPHPRSLSTAVLARTIGKLPKHHASASAKSRDVNSTGDFNRYFVGVSARQQPHPYGRSVGNTSSMSLSARTAGGHSLEKKGDSSVVCILTNLLF